LVEVYVNVRDVILHIFKSQHYLNLYPQVSSVIHSALVLGYFRQFNGFMGFMEQ